MKTADRFLAVRGTGRSLTHRDLADPGRGLDPDPGRGLAGRDPAARELGRRTDQGDRGDPAAQGLAARGDLAGRGLAARGDLAERGLAARGDLAERGLAARGDPVEQDLADRGDLADRDLADRGDLADRVRVDGRRGALTIGVMTRWVAPRMRLAASAHETTARHLRRKREDSAGMMGLLPVGRRVTGSARRLRVVGTVLRLRVVGTTRGTGRTAA